MEFLGVGPAELILILVVALIFVGPERLPRLAADIARTIREIRKYTGSIAAEFTEVLEEFEKDTAGDRSQWKEIGQGLTDATKSVTDALKQAHADAATAGSAAQAAPADTSPASGGEANGSPMAAPTPAPAAPSDATTPAPADIPPATALPTNGNGATPLPERARESQ